MVDSAAIREVGIATIDTEIAAARAAGKYVVLFDTTGNCEVFFRYKGTLVEFHKSVIGITMGAKTLDDTMDELRRTLVHTMKSGDKFVIYFDKMAPNFKTQYTKDGAFPTKDLTNFALWREIDNYKKVVKEEEDVDVNNNKGWYRMKDDFELIFMGTYQDEETCKQVLDNIPNSD